MRRITLPTCVLLLLCAAMTDSYRFMASAEAEPSTATETIKPDTAPQPSDAAAATADETKAHAPGDISSADERKSAEAASADIDIPSAQPTITPAPELRDPVDALIAEKDAEQAATPANIKPVPLPTKRAVTRDEVCATLASAAQDNGLPVPFLIRLIWQESGFDPNAVSRVGAQGMAQFMPETARTVGLNNPFDPLQAVSAAARLLRNLVQQFGNVGLAAAAYNAGPKRISDWLEKRGKLPNETRSYVTNITGQVPERWKASNAQAATTVPRQAPCQREALIAGLSAPQSFDVAPQPTRVAHTPTVTMAPTVRLAARPAHGRMRATIRIAALSRRASASTPVQLSAHSRVAAKPKVATIAHRRVHVAAAGTHRR